MAHDASVLGQVGGRIEQMGCAADEFEAVFVTGGGVERRVPWRWLQRAEVGFAVFE